MRRSWSIWPCLRLTPRASVQSGRFACHGGQYAPAPKHVLCNLTNRLRILYPRLLPCRYELGQRESRGFRTPCSNMTMEPDHDEQGHDATRMSDVRLLARRALRAALAGGGLTAVGLAGPLSGALATEQSTGTTGTTTTPETETSTQTTSTPTTPTTTTTGKAPLRRPRQRRRPARPNRPPRPRRAPFPRRLPHPRAPTPLPSRQTHRA